MRQRGLIVHSSLLRLAAQHSSATRPHMQQLWIFSALVVAAMSGCSPAVDGRESSGDKHEWSILQSREYDARQELVAAPRFTSDDGYVLLVVPRNDRSKNIWIMLSPKSPPFYKQLPQGGYTISRSTLDIVSRQGIASSTVQEVLASHVAE